jgi:hypothetical protein
MRIFAGFVAMAALLIGTPSLAADSEGIGSLLNRVTFKLSSEQWVTSKTALVTVGISAGVSDAALEKIQDDVLKKLNQLTNKGEWHITSFDRNLDQSGLENIRMQAQARLPSNALPSLRDKTKAMSKPGETYTLDSIQFTPSEDELRDANTALRGNVYQQAKDELDRLNKAYPDQKYYMHDINFLSDYQPVAPMARNGMMMAMAMKSGDGGGNLAVGDKLVLSATVVLAAMPDQGLTKTIH